MSSDSLSLVILTAIGGRAHVLPTVGELGIGRGNDCDVVIDDVKASRRHALLRIHPGARIEVVDLGSSNGTLVGSRRAPAHATIDLTVGTPVTIGSTVLIVQRSSASRAERVFNRPDFEARLTKALAASGGRVVGTLRIRFEDDDLVSKKTTVDEGSGEVTRTELLDRTLDARLEATEVVWVELDGTFHLLLTRDSAGAVREVGDDIVGTLGAAGFVAGFVVDIRSAAATPVPPSGAAHQEGALARLEPVIARIASGNISVLLVGETGVGKEVLARRIHALSRRAAAPFVAFNCAAISETLLESELFGYERGAFSGATQTKSGLLESANGGTVFLDEIGELPLGLQSKLLRVLEQREVLRVGALRPRALDVRFVAATNRDLEAEIAERRFRQDLYFRLNGSTIEIPPLRERVEEIGSLAALFAERARREAGRPEAVDFAPEVLALFERYAWPGNVRELRNVVERAVLLAPEAVITLDHVPKLRPSMAPPAPSAAPPPFGSPNDERAAILAALEACAFNQTQAAKRLGMSRRTFVSRLDAYGLPRPRKPV